MRGCSIWLALIVGTVLVWSWRDTLLAPTGLLPDDIARLASYYLVATLAALISGYSLLYRTIYNHLVEADRRRAHEGVDRQFDGKRA